MAHTPGDMHVQPIALDQMNPAPYNPAVELQPGDPEYEAIKASVREFGLIDPLIWNKRTGNIVGGHQRYKILRDLGYTHADTVVLDLDETAEIRANLALRKAQGRWDERKLTEVLADLKARAGDGVVPDVPGFQREEFARYLQQARALHATDFLAGWTAETTPGTPPFTMAPPRDGSFRTPTSPLDGLDADDDDSDGSDEDEDGDGEETLEPGLTPNPRADYVTLQYAVTAPQRDIVLEAIRLAKLHFGLGNSIEALVAICTWYRQSREGGVEP